MTQTNPDFAARLAQIEARRQSAAPQSAPKRDLADRLYALSLVAAFLVGMLVVFAARYARFHLTGVTPGSTEIASNNLLVDFSLAFMAGILLHQIFHFKRPEHVGAKTFGMVVCAVTMHIPVHYFPDLFAVVFSPDWVHQVIRLTEPTVPALF